MPKHEIIHASGREIPNELKETLLKYFKDSDLKKLERFGGRILFSITAPYTNKKRESKDSAIINEQFVKKIKELKDSPQELQESLNNLTAKQLREIAVLIGQPIRSSANRAEIISELIRHFHDEDLWQRISGSTPQES